MQIEEALAITKQFPKNSDKYRSMMFITGALSLDREVPDQYYKPFAEGEEKEAAITVIDNSVRKFKALEPEQQQMVLEVFKIIQEGGPEDEAPQQ